MKRIFLWVGMVFSSGLLAQQVELLHKDLNKFQNIRDFSSSINGTEAYFTLQSPNQDISQIVVVKNGNWQKPILLSFCDAYSYLEPFLSADEKRLYFASNRPKNDSITTKSDYDIWYVERADSKNDWSTPINLGSPVNSEQDEFYPALADNQNLYFTMDSKAGLGKDDIYFCKWDGKEYAAPVLLNSNINSAGYEFNAFIAKDESFLIYTKYGTADGLGSGDLYLAKRDKNGQWLPATNMGNSINTPFMEYCPFYDSNTHTLYFTSKRNTLIPKKFGSVAELQQHISEGENGLSKLYRHHIKI